MEPASLSVSMMMTRYVYHDVVRWIVRVLIITIVITAFWVSRLQLPFAKATSKIGGLNGKLSTDPEVSTVFRSTMSTPVNNSSSPSINKPIKNHLDAVSMIDSMSVLDVSSMSHSAILQQNATPLTVVRSKTSMTFVSYGPTQLDSRRIGNRLFNVAALLHVAWITGRQAVVPTNDGGFYLNDSLSASTYYWELNTIFNQLDNQNLVTRAGYDVICGSDFTGYGNRRAFWDLTVTGNCVNVIAEKSMIYDESWMSNVINHTDKSILLSGYLQSWKYFKGSEQKLREVLIFNRTLVEQAQRFLSEARPTTWTPGSFALVSMHVRRGDFIQADKLRFGYMAPPSGFYLRAARRFLHRYRQVLFVVASDDPSWARRVLASLDQDKDCVSVAYTAYGTAASAQEQPPKQLPSAESDLAVLSRCKDGAIVSAGTFSWWAAWLADPPLVVHFAGTPRKGSKLYDSYRRDDYIPPHWTASH